MPETRETLETLEEKDLTLNPGTNKVSVLTFLASSPNQGYEPREIAAQTDVSIQSVYKVLQRLREEDLIEKISGHYLVNADCVGEINDMLLTTQQFAVAEEISDANTAPEEVDPQEPEDLPDPDDDLLAD